MKSLGWLSQWVFGAWIAISSAQAEGPAGYFRVWEGFSRTGLTSMEFLQGLPPFLKETVKLYGGQNVLSNYLVTIPPANKPAFIPDELALIALSSEADYRRIRETPEGQAYGARHWDLFERASSRSAPQFVDYWQARPNALVSGLAYDMIGERIDWAAGYTRVFIGIKKDGMSAASFLSRLQSHVELTSRKMRPLGLRGYVITAHENYEVAYLNWSSQSAHDQAQSDSGAQEAFADAGEILDPLMYEEARLTGAPATIEPGKAYSITDRSF